MQLAVANCSGFVASLTLYPAQDGPNYVRGHRIVLGLLIAAWCLIGLNILYIQRENREKAAGRREQYRGCGDDRDPDFKYLV